MKKKPQNNDSGVSAQRLGLNLDLKKEMDRIDSRTTQHDDDTTTTTMMD